MSNCDWKGHVDDISYLFIRALTHDDGVSHINSFRRSTSNTKLISLTGNRGVENAGVWHSVFVIHVQ